LINYRNLTSKELEVWVSEQGLPAYRGRQLFRWLWHPGFDGFEQATDFSMTERGNSHGSSVMEKWLKPY